MENHWEKNLSCAGRCQRCGETLNKKSGRVLSVFDHQPLCLACKRAEEARPDYPDQSKQMIAECIATTGKPYGDTAGYCFHHFLPFRCRD